MAKFVSYAPYDPKSGERFLCHICDEVRPASQFSHVLGAIKSMGALCCKGCAKLRRAA